MNKILIVVFSVVVLSLGGAYLYFVGQEFTISIPESELRDKVSEKLPFTKNYLIIFDVTLENPRVALEDGSNRVNAGLDVVLEIKIGKSRKPLRGQVDASGLVDYVSNEGQFYLTDIAIDQLNIQGIPEKYIERSQQVISNALKSYYSKNAIYTLKTTDAKQAAAKMVLKDVVVSNKELVITLGI